MFQEVSQEPPEASKSPDSGPRAYTVRTPGRRVLTGALALKFRGSESQCRERISEGVDFIVKVSARLMGFSLLTNLESL